MHHTEKPKGNLRPRSEENDSKLQFRCRCREAGYLRGSARGTRCSSTIREQNATQFSSSEVNFGLCGTGEATNKNSLLVESSTPVEIGMCSFRCRLPPCWTAGVASVVVPPAT